MKKTTIYCTYFIFVLFLTQAVFAININEIMYNPEGSDDNKEFVEIKGTGNLSGFVIADSYSNDTLEMLQYKKSSFSLIVEEGFNYSGLNCSVYSAGSSIGNNLNNDKDSVYLYDSNSNMVDNTSYDGSLANGNGYSIELWNGFWNESLITGGSPCMENILTDNTATNQTTTNQTGNITANYTNQTTSNVTNNTSTNQSSPTTNQTTNTTTNQTTSQETNQTYNNTNTTNTNHNNSNTTYNNTNSSYTNTTNQQFNSTSNTNSQTNNTEEYCNISIGLQIPKQIYENKEKIEFYNKLSKKEYTYEIEYWIEDLEGNIVKSKTITANTNKKSYTPSIKQKEKALIIKNRIVNVDCNNIASQTSSWQLIVVYYPDYEDEEEEDNNEDECSECDDYCEELKKENKGEDLSIKSFYTRAQKIGDSINLYSSIEGTGEYTLMLSSLDMINKTDVFFEDSKKASYSVSTKNGQNTFLLEIVRENTTIDSKRLSVYRESEEENGKDEDEKQEKQASEGKNSAEQQNKTTKNNQTIPSLLLSPAKSPEEPLITGKTVALYESKNEKVKKYLNYGLVVVFIAGAVVFIRGKIHGRKKSKHKGENTTGVGKGKNNL